jgi:hypothetical protein
MTPSCIGTNVRTLSAYTLDRFQCMNIESQTHYCVQKIKLLYVWVSVSVWAPRETLLWAMTPRGGDFYMLLPSVRFMWRELVSENGHFIWRSTMTYALIKLYVAVTKQFFFLSHPMHACVHNWSVITLACFFSCMQLLTAPLNIENKARLNYSWYVES